MSNFDSYENYNTLVVYAIEQALLDVSTATLYEVGHVLYQKHNCNFSDCLKHPDYLKSALGELFGRSSDTIMASIIKSINSNLKKFSEEKLVSDFLVQINKSD